MTAVTRRDFVKAAAVAPAALSGMAAPASAQQPRASAPGERFDYVIAGAGHNSLACAGYLAKAGFKVLVLEGRAMIGGGAKTAEVLLPGFKQDLCSSVHGGLQTNPLLRDNELNIRDYGYENIDPEIVMHYPFLDGASITVYRDNIEETAASIARVSKKDAETFRRMAPIRAKYVATPPAERAKLREAFLFERLASMSGFDAAAQMWESPHVRAASLSGGHFGAVPGSDPGTGGNAFTLFGQLEGRPIAKGGSGMLTIALGRFIEANGGVILTNKGVTRLIIDGGKCVGVECADGSQYRAGKAVVSTIHVKHLLEMAPRALFGDGFAQTVDLWRAEHAMFAFHFALAEPPKYRLVSGGTISSCEAAVLQRPESIFGLNYDEARGELLNLDDMPLQIVTPSVADPSRVPAGMATLKIEGTLPYALKGGPQQWDVVKDQVADRLLTTYMKLTTNITREKVLAKALFSPVDIERMNPAMWRGSAHHGDRRFNQLVGNRTPIPGLYQTGACTAPGGSITGMAGRNAAAVILQDAGTSIEAVVAKGRTA